MNPPRILAVALYSLIFSGAAPAKSPVEGWEWLREDPAGWRSSNDVLELRAQKGRVWSGAGAKNLLVEQKQAGGRQAEVVVSHGAPKTKYEQGGLLAYRDDDHFVKLIVEFIDGDYFIVMAREVGGKGKVFTKIKIADKSARIRLAVEGDRVTASFAPRGGSEFKPAGECELPGAAEARFALFTQDGSDDEIRWIRFEDLSTQPAAASVTIGPGIVDDGATYFLPPRRVRSGGVFETRRLDDEFHAEGAAFGDINKDGVNDVVYGPFWFEGPDFERRHLIYKPNRFAIATYSNNFMPYVDDLDADGWPDVLVLGFPGRAKSTYWLENPGAGGGAWQKHIVFRGPGNESPAWADVDGDGKKEVVCSVGGQFVIVRPDRERPREPWEMVPISPPKSTGGFFTHGLGLGDVDGDGLVDLLEKSGWWQQRRGAGALWVKHAYPFSAAGGAQMFAYDFDGDGDNDVITSLAAHGFGLAWFEHVRDGGGAIRFVRHQIMGSRPGDSDYALAFSQLHGVDLADVDGDGVRDLITGKRFWAHGGHDPGGRGKPVIYWFRTVRGGGPGEVDFVPHLIDDQSGVGTVVNSGDLDGDGRLDIVIGNKKGCFVHLQTAGEARPLTKVKRRPRAEVEGETIQVLARTGDARPQNMAGFGAGVWSGDSQLWWTGGEVGDVLTLAVPVPSDGSYEVAGAFTKAVDYGIFELSLDGQVLGAGAIDFFQPVGVSHTGELPLGKLQLERGESELSVKIAGANPEAVKGFMFGLDYLRLNKLESKPQALFDGKTLDGWRGDRKWWRSEGGAIVGEIPAGGNLSKNQFLFWDGELHDFELDLKYRVGGDKTANSGVQVRCKKLPGGGAAGYQADIDDGAVWAGRIYDEQGRGLIVERGSKVVIGRAGERDAAAFRDPEEFSAIAKNGDWNEYRIRAVGDRIRVWLNGQPTADLTDRQIGQHDFSGALALQLHSGPGPAKVEFKDIALTPLGRTAPPEVPVVSGVGRSGISPPGKNLGFEDGTLDGWTATGDVWDGSPIEGDTVTPRRPGQASRHDGKFWVGGYERTRSDAGQGTLTSDAFEVTHPWASFLVGAGPHPELRVELLDAAGGDVIFKASGTRELEDMYAVHVDLTEHQGKQIRVRVVDEHPGHWGHINYDDFRFHAARPVARPARVATNPLLQHLTPNPAGAGADPTVAGMWVPEGFQVELIAKEPTVTQPIAFTFDARGRLWVAEAHAYPRRQPAGQGNDRIIILEDADGDGGFEKKTTFASGLNLVSGLEVGFGGVWVGAAPQLLFIPDGDRDDVPDGEPVVLLDGWGLADTHETLNSFTWGPDGWLYGNQGVFNHSEVGKPGTPAARRVEMRAGVWRYHPTRGEFEIFAHGCSNQWGIDFDEMGHMFITHCRSAWGGGPTTFVVQGGHYWNQSNSHHAEFVSGGQAGWNPGPGKVFRNFLPSSAAYGHGEGGAGRPGSRALYGGHSHVGTMIYLGCNWPGEYRNQLFTHNLHGHQMNRQVNEREGSGFNTVHAGSDQLLTPDPRFIGVDLKYGPDGAVYMIDWYDKQHCHTNNTDAWDRSDGRIYRMSWKETYKPAKVDLRSESLRELALRVTSCDEWSSRTARRLLQERLAARDGPQQPRGPVFEILSGARSTPETLRAMWLLHAIGVEASVDRLDHEDENVRAWAVRLGVEEGALRGERLQQIARDDPSPMVRLAIASALPRLEKNARWELAGILGEKEEDLADTYLPKMIWYGIAPLAKSDPVRAMEIARRTPMPVLADSIVWYLSRDLVGRELVVDWVREATPERARQLLDLVAFSLPASGKFPAPRDWSGLSAKLRGPETAAALDKLGGLFGDATVVAKMRAAVADKSAPMEQRQAAFDFLKATGDTGCAAEFLAILEEPAFRGQVLPLLGRFDDEEVAAAVLQLLPALGGAERNAAVGALSSRPVLATALLTEIKNGRAKKSLLSSLHVRQMQALGDAALDGLVAEVWGRVGQSDAGARAAIAKYRKLYAEAPLWSFDRRSGEAVFVKVCAVCHTKDGKGKRLGPDLTGSHTSGVDYFLESIVDPNSVVGENFQLNVVTRKDGVVVSGMPASETPDQLTIQTLTEPVAIPKAQIKSRQVLQQSMMPPALLDSLTEKEVIELLKYLTTG